MTAQARILRLFGKALSGLCKFVYRRPDAPARKCLTAGETSSQRPLQTMQWPEFSEGESFRCALCVIDPENKTELGQIIGVLPVGFVVQLPVISAILGVRFKTVLADLNFLRHRVGYPIKMLSPGFLLTEPIYVCKKCAQIGEQVRRTEVFQRKFKATIALKYES